LNQAVTQEYALVAQYNYAIPHSFSVANPLDVLINATLDATTPAQVMRIPMLLQQSESLDNTSACIDWATFSSRANQQKALSIGSSWPYITCSYLPGSDVAVSPNNSLFVPFEVSEPINNCVNSDWVTPYINDTEAEWEARFQITDKDLDAVQRLLIINGQYDRTSSLAQVKLTLSSDRNHSRVLTVQGLAHGDTGYSESFYPRGLRPQVDAVCIILPSIF
jgi:hypothetical protein